jgi:DNA-binding CsgD family transcriptional regulator
MASPRALVGRESEQEYLANALERAKLGEGSLVLLAGEAGIGKTSLTEALASNCDGVALTGRASQSAPVPYGPVVTALRSSLRGDPAALSGCGSLLPHLALLLPELGDPPRESDPATVVEAIRCALASLAGDDQALLVLDDLQWSDEATLELLPALAEPLREMPVLVVAAYRSDGLPRQHTLRRVRQELRRGGRLDERRIGPLDAHGTGELLHQLLDASPAPSLTAAIQDRTQGVPFFVAELARALQITDLLKRGRGGLELADGGPVPVPDTVRDAVLIGVAELSPDARAAAEAAAVAGESFDLELVGEISSPAGVAELLERELVAETSPGRGTFRHALAREALYADVPWLRRRALHRELAERLEKSGGPPIELSMHWEGTGEDAPARAALLRAAEDSRAVHAHRDAAEAWRRALELWPEGEDADRRVEVLESYAHSAELSGDLAEATRGWREICAIRSSEDEPAELADAQRRLGGLLDLRGDRRAAIAARQAAASSFAAAGMRAEAATERLALGAYERGSANYSEAIEQARAAREDARAEGRVDLEARALGLEGVSQTKRGDYGGGLETIQSGLAIALEHDLTPVAAELYQRLSLALYDSADYRTAESTLDTALELCRTDGAASTEEACVTCMVYVLRERGEWPRALEMGRELIAEGTAVWVSEGLLGAIHAYQGKISSARRMLSSSLATASRIGHFNMTVDGTTALAYVSAAEGQDDQAAELCRAVLARWESSEDRHYAIRGLRWGAAFFARRGEIADTHACAEALTRIASDTGHPDALAALAHAIAEAALAEGDVETAAAQLSRAVELHSGLDVPLEAAEIGLRAGVALAAAGDRERGLERLRDAYRTARKLGARPLAAEAAGEVAALGESVASRLGKRAAADVDGAGLTRRELEVVRLVAEGHTNKEIAQQLVVSPRTIDMHVRNTLRKLDCRSRLEAARRAGELGLLETSP